jgi:GNAT superfamily N-acetyltransferase
VFPARIQAYIRTNAARGRDTERIGPFLATFSRTTTNPFLNYAIPDADATPSASDASALIDAYRSRGRTPRLEFLPSLAPAVEPALVAAGFGVEARVPLMHCPPSALIEQPIPDGIELLAPETDDEIMAMLVAQHEAYNELSPPTTADVVARRKHFAEGGLGVLARDKASGEPAGGGGCDVIFDGIGELAGFGVRETYRRRGIAAAITANLTRRAHESGAITAFLTPGGAEAERIYARAGYRPVGEVLFLSHSQ